MPRKQYLQCYFGCRVDGPLHRYPKWQDDNQEKFNAWKDILDPAIIAKGNDYIYNNIRICYRHFDKSYHLPSNRLTRNAVPTLNIGLHPQIQTNTVAVLDDGHYQISKSSKNTSPGIKVNKQHFNLQNKLKVEKGLARKIDLLKTRMLKIRAKCKSQTMKICAAERLSKNKVFLEALDKFPEPAKIFTYLQLKHFKKPKGRKYSIQEKILSLTIYKQSPKAYRLLRKLFVLPSKRTLQNILSYLVIKPGINYHVVESLKNSVQELPEEKKLCCLIFDEVSLATGVYYNTSFKQIIGFEDNGYNKTSKIADHALVLMVKSLKGKFSQPLSFTFCQSMTKKQELKQIIMECIKVVTDIGLKIVCTVCDQSATNMSTIKELQKETIQKYLRNDKEYRGNAFEVDDNKIFPIFDPPHLIKGIRNNLLTKNLRYIQDEKIKIAKWEHILQLMEKDIEEDNLRLCNKITEAHYVKEKIPKMKVKYATQIFSQRLAAAMKFCTRHGIISQECGDTADLLYLFDQLFDSFNGHSYKKTKKALKSALKLNSNHFKFWEEMLPILRSMGFESKNTDGIITYKKVPSILNFIHNIIVYKEMWAHLHNNYNLTSLLPRAINQDPLENFFSKIRSNGFRNTNPTCDQFINAYKTLLINNFASPHSVNANCEDDNSKLLKSMECVLNKEACTSIIGNTRNDIYNYCIDNTLEILMSSETTCAEPEDNINIHTECKSYVAGSVLKKAKRKIFKKCNQCSKILISEEIIKTSFIYERDYTKKSLIYPSNIFKTLLNDIFKIIHRCIQESSESPYLLSIILFNIDMYCDFKNILSCEVHGLTLKSFIINHSLNIIVHSWCGRVNKILKGRLTIDIDKNDKVQVGARNYFIRHEKFNKRK